MLVIFVLLLEHYQPCDLALFTYVPHVIFWIKVMQWNIPFHSRKSPELWIQILYMGISLTSKINECCEYTSLGNLCPFNPWSAELFLCKPWRPKGFLQFETIINVLFSSFRFIWILMLWVYGQSKYFYFYSAGMDFSCQNLTSTDVRFWRLKSTPAL